MKPDTAMVPLTDLVVINPDGSVGSPSTLFKQNETVYVSVVTDAAGEGTIRLKWMYGDRVIDEPVKKVSFQGPGATSFQLQNSGGFPAGSYSVEVFIDDVKLILSYTPDEPFRVTEPL